MILHVCLIVLVIHFITHHILKVDSDMESTIIMIVLISLAISGGGLNHA